MPRHERPNPDTDPFRPPAIPTEVCCLHCGQEYESYLIQWHEEIDERGEIHGFWCCPTQGCDGKGFGFDIFPTDPEYRGEDGEPMWFSDDEEDDEFDLDLEMEDEESGSGTLLEEEEFDADEFLASSEPFDLDLPPPPADMPPPLDLDFDQDTNTGLDNADSFGRYRFREDEDDIPF